MTQLKEKEASAPSETNPDFEIEGVAGNAVVPWEAMGFGQKFSYMAKNVTVEPIVALYIMPSVLAGLATQNLNLEKACRVNLAYPDHVCTALAARNTTGFQEEEIAVQQLVAGMQSWKTVLQSALPALLILFIGAWSDRTGRRKPLMLFPVIGEFLTSVSLIICTYWFYELSMEVAGVSEALWPALTGGWFTMFMGCFSFISDITSVESRTFRIGAVNIFVSAGIPIGMALSGVLYVKLGFYGVFTISTLCHVVCFLYGFFRVKEVPIPLAVKEEEKAKACWCAPVVDFFAFRGISETFKVAFKNGAKNRRKRVTVLIIITTTLFGPIHGEMTVMYLFQRYRFNWNEVQCSIFSTYSMLTHLAGMMLSIGVFSHLLKIDDALVGAMSCTSKILAGFVYAFASTDWMMYLAPLVDIISGMSFITMRSITSKLVPNDELGKISSLIGVCEALMPLVYGPMYSAVYRATMDTLPGAFFLLGGGLTLPAVLLFLWLYTEHRGDRAREAAEEAENKTEVSKEKLEPSDARRGLDNIAFETKRAD